MKKLLRIGKISLVVTQLLSIGYAQDIRHLEKDEAAPFDGFIIDRPMEKKMRGFREDSKILEQQVITLADIGVIQDVQLQAANSRVESLSKENTSLEKRNRFNKVVFFALGVLATGGAVYLGSKLSNSGK